MTVQEALRETQGRDAGAVNRASVSYAETLIQLDEHILAAVICNAATPREHFPGIAVLTDRRILAVCGLPGIKRCVSLLMDEWERCDEISSFLNYKAVFRTKETAVSFTVNPEVCERFSRCLAVLRGEAEEFDAVNGAEKDGILNPTLMRNMMRKRRARKKEAARRKAELAAIQERFSAGAKDPGDIAGEEADPKTVARRLNRQLAQAERQGVVADTDPRAVAARLARELVNENGGEQT